MCLVLTEWSTANLINWITEHNPIEATISSIEGLKLTSPLWKVRLALGVFLVAPLRYAPYFRFDVRGNLLDGLFGNNFCYFYLF
jgi:hypothetical protein